MTDEPKNILRSDLIELCRKHDISNASFCGSSPDDQYYGLMCIEKTTTAEVFKSAMNIGRLWQHTRMVIRQILDDFEKPES